MAQKLIGNYFLPQKANGEPDKVVAKSLKRPLREEEDRSDDEDEVCISTKKPRVAVIESDDDGVSSTSLPPDADADETKLEDAAFASSSGTHEDEKLKRGIPLRKTAPRKSSRKKKDSKQDAPVSDATSEELVPKDSEKMKIDEASPVRVVKAEKMESNDDNKTAVHSFFAPKAAQLGSKKTASSPAKKVETARTSEEVTSSDAGEEVVSDTTYDPARDNYHPVKHACWKEGQRVPYIALAKTFEEIEKVSARLRSIEILSNFLCSVVALTPADLVSCVYLCLNKLAPAYEGIELGIGENLLMKAIAQATGRSVDKIKSEVEEKGDLGLVAESSRSMQKTMLSSQKLTVASVFKNFKEVAMMSGHSSMSKKADKIKSMFVACRGPEARFLIRSLGGKLRIGMAEQSVLQAISSAFVLSRSCEGKKPTGDVLKKKIEEAALVIKTTYCECPNYDKILPLLLDHPLEELPLHCKITPGVPIKPMLAHPTKGIHEVMSKFEESEFVCEFKYDGERAQIHMLETGEVMIYSRNQENNTTKYTDVASRMTAAVNPNKTVTSAIVDAEAVAWDPVNKQILPFQVLSTRKRKDVNSKDVKVQVCIYAFDLLYLNGESLVKETLRRRRELLHEMFSCVEGEFAFAKSMASSGTDEVAEFLEESIKSSCEGLMVKTLDVEATYEIAKRSRNWLKLKKDYLEGVGDTIDLVVIGGYHGMGKRTGRYGGFLLACYDEKNEEYQAICKIGTAFTDADLEKHSDFFKGHIIDSPRTYYRFDESQCPDKWFDAVQVWEVKAADLSLSPVYKAALGMVDSKKGISLRFPRFVRVRDDKKPEEATDSSQIASMYRSQDQIVSQVKNKAVDEDFY